MGYQGTAMLESLHDQTVSTETTGRSTDPWSEWASRLTASRHTRMQSAKETENCTKVPNLTGRQLEGELEWGGG